MYSQTKDLQKCMDDQYTFLSRNCERITIRLVCYFVWNWDNYWKSRM